MAAYKEILTIDEFIMVRVESCASDIVVAICEFEFMVWIQPKKWQSINN